MAARGAGSLGRERESGARAGKHLQSDPMIVLIRLGCYKNRTNNKRTKKHRVGGLNSSHLYFMILEAAVRGPGVDALDSSRPLAGLGGDRLLRPVLLQPFLCTCTSPVSLPLLERTPLTLD